MWKVPTCNPSSSRTFHLVPALDGGHERARVGYVGSVDSEQPVPWLEKLMRDAEAAGEFDYLSGKGKPIDDLDSQYEPAWWARRFIERERLSEAAIGLATRLRRQLPRILAGRDDNSVRVRLIDFNREIEEINERLDERQRLSLLDVDEMLTERRRRHS